MFNVLPNVSVKHFRSSSQAEAPQVRASSNTGRAAKSISGVDESSIPNPVYPLESVAFDELLYLEKTENRKCSLGWVDLQMIRWRGGVCLSHT